MGRRNRKTGEQQLKEENRKLHEQLKNLQTKRAFLWEDRIKLAIIDRIPFSLWACDRKFQIVLWEGLCEEIYGYAKHDALGKNYLELFVDPPERAESESDCLRIIDSDIVFKNYIAQDRAFDGSPRQLCTNCFRVWDDEGNQWLQAEVAMNMEGLEHSNKKWRTLREMGIALLSEQKNSLVSERLSLVGRVYIAESDKGRILDTMISDLNKYLKSAGSDQSINSKLNKLNNVRTQIRLLREKIVDKLRKADTFEVINRILDDVVYFEQVNVKEWALKEDDVKVEG